MRMAAVEAVALAVVTGGEMRMAAVEAVALAVVTGGAIRVFVRLGMLIPMAMAMALAAVRGLIRE
jgi:hypothetical protein